MFLPFEWVSWMWSFLVFVEGIMVETATVIDLVAKSAVNARPWIALIAVIADFTINCEPSIRWVDQTSSLMRWTHLSPLWTRRWDRRLLRFRCLYRIIEEYSRMARAAGWFKVMHGDHRMLLSQLYYAIHSTSIQTVCLNADLKYAASSDGQARLANDAPIGSGRSSSRIYRTFEDLRPTREPGRQRKMGGKDLFI
jgi:hypothetical protein